MFVQFFQISSRHDDKPYIEYEGTNLEVNLGAGMTVELDGKLLAYITKRGELRCFVLGDDPDKKKGYYDEEWLYYMTTSPEPFIPKAPVVKEPRPQPLCHKCGSVLYEYTDTDYTQYTHCPVCNPVNQVTNTEGKVLIPRVVK